MEEKLDEMLTLLRAMIDEQKIQTETLRDNAKSISRLVQYLTEPPIATAIPSCSVLAE